MYALPRTLRQRQQRLAPVFRHGLRQRHFSQALRRARGPTPSQAGGGPVRYQAVRFKSPALFSWRRLLTFTAYGAAVYTYLNLVAKYLDVEIEIVDDEALGAEEAAATAAAADDKDRQEREGGPMTDEDGEEDDDEGPIYAEEDSTFIPLTWAKKLPRTFYKGSDPEWQEFIKVAKDKPRHAKIQDELVQIVFAGSAQHPLIARQLGKELKIGRYWLDISFPDGPPQEYLRSGLEIGDGFIAWSQQQVSPEQQWRLTRALWPKAMFDSVWMTTKVMAGIQYRRVKQLLGWDGNDPFSPEERYRHAMEMMQKQQAAREGKKIGETQTPHGTPDPTALVSASAAAAAGAQSTTKTPSAVGDSKKLPWHIPVPLPNAGATSSDVPIAMNVFSHTLSKQWNPKKTEPPRGTFVVQGLIEVRGQRGRMLFDVQSCYDPKTGKFVMVNAAVRNFKRWNQPPRGGP